MLTSCINSVSEFRKRLNNFEKRINTNESDCNKSYANIVKANETKPDKSIADDTTPDISNEANIQAASNIQNAYEQNQPRHTNNAPVCK